MQNNYPLNQGLTVLTLEWPGICGHKHAPGFFHGFYAARFHPSGTLKAMLSAFAASDEYGGGAHERGFKASCQHDARDAMSVLPLISHLTLAHAPKPGSVRRHYPRWVAERFTASLRCSDRPAHQLSLDPGNPPDRCLSSHSTATALPRPMFPS